MPHQLYNYNKIEVFQLYSFQLAMDQDYLAMNWGVRRSCFFSQDRHHDAPHFTSSFNMFRSIKIHVFYINLSGIR